MRQKDVRLKEHLNYRVSDTHHPFVKFALVFLTAGKIKIYSVQTLSLVYPRFEILVHPSAP